MNPAIQEFVPQVAQQQQQQQHGVLGNGERKRKNKRQQNRKNKKRKNGGEYVPAQNHSFVLQQQAQRAQQQYWEQTSYPVRDFVRRHGYFPSQEPIQPGSYFPGQGYIQESYTTTNLGLGNAMPPAQYHDTGYGMTYAGGDARNAQQVHPDNGNFGTAGPVQNPQAVFQEKVEAEKAEKKLGRLNAEKELAKRVEIVRSSGTDLIVPELKPLADMLHEEIPLRLGRQLTPHEEGYLERVREMASMPGYLLMAAVNLPITPAMGIPLVQTTGKGPGNNDGH